jgi:predicted lipoprotein with Yx(FWY)xxD motif
VLVCGAVALVLAGCGSSSSKSASGAAATGASTSAASTASSSYGAAGTTTTTAAAGSASAAGTIVSVKHNKVGTILAAGPKHLTVYLFEGDHGTTSACSGACAQVWPPVTTGAAPTVAGGAMSADLGTVTRADGTKQVTYKGHPLYFFAKDGDDGDAYGQGIKSFGSDWYVLRPNGSKLDES